MDLNDVYHQLIGKGVDPSTYRDYLEKNRTTVRRGWALAMLAILIPAAVVIASAMGVLPMESWAGGVAPFIGVGATLVLWGISVSYAVKAMKSSQAIFKSLDLQMASPTVGSTISEYTNGQVSDTENVQAFLSGKRHGHEVKIGLGHQDSFVIYQAEVPEFRATYENGQWQMSAHLPAGLRQALHQAGPSGAWEQLKSCYSTSKGIIIHRRAKMTNLPWLFDLWLAEKIVAATE